MERPHHRKALVESLEPRTLLAAVSQPLALPNTRLGVNYVDWWHDAFSTAASDQRITNLANNTDSNTIEIVPTWYMSTKTSNTIFQDVNKSLEDSGVVHAIQLAKSLGLSVILKPHVDVLDNSAWRAWITPGDSNAWFNSYKSFINHYADMATAQGVDMFCVGTELKTMSGNSFTSQWNTVVDGIEQRFAGQLTYAANWDEFKNVKWWNRMDFIGIDQYTPLGPSNQFEATPSVSTLISRWQPIVADVSSWRSQNGFTQKVLLTEIGYQSVQDGHRTFYTQSTTYDPDAQKRMYDAATQVWTSQDWMAGMLWWAWYQDSSPADFSPIGKPAQNDLKTGSISGTVFNDADGDGVKDAGEAGVSGWKVYLDADGDNTFDAGEYSVTTGGGGAYLIPDLLVGSYKVRLVNQAGWTKTTPGGNGFDLSLDGGQSLANQHFGVKGGTVVEDLVFTENFDGISPGTNLPTAQQPRIYATTAGTTYVQVQNSIAKSAANSARFHDTTVDPSLNYYPQMLVQDLGPSAAEGWTTESVDINFDYYVPAAADQANYFTDGVWLMLSDDANYTGFAEHLIKGDGIFVKNTNGTGGGTISPAAGGAWHHVKIVVNGISGGNINMITTLDNLTPVTTVVPAGGQTKWNNVRWEIRDNDGSKDFYLDNIDIRPHVASSTGSIAGNVFNDSNSNGTKDGAETGINSWVVYLDANNNNAKDGGETSTTTAASGAYTFANLTAGTHRVKQVLQGGYRKTAPGSGIPGHDVTLTGGDAIAGKNFGNTTNILLAGKVSNDVSSAGVAGVIISIISNGSTVATRTTDANGMWQVKGLSAGAGSAELVLPAGYSFTNPSDGKYVGSMSSGQQNANLNFSLHLNSPAPAAQVASASTILRSDFSQRLIADLV